MVAEMHRWDGSHVSFLRKTELASTDALAGKNLGKCSNGGWSRAAPEFLTTDLPDDGIRTAGDRYAIPRFSTPARRSGGGQDIHEMERQHHVKQIFSSAATGLCQPRPSVGQ